jgi:hypothetical protein
MLYYAYISYLFFVIILNVHDNKCMYVSPFYMKYASDILVCSFKV